MSYHVALTRSDSTDTAVVRSRVQPSELPRFVPAACGEVWAFIQSAGLQKPGRHVALYLDAAGNVEVGAEVAAPFSGTVRVHCSRLPSGPVATTVHFGSYGRLAEAHRAIRHWCAERGHRISPVSWEVYGHWEESWNADPSKIRTDVFQLLEEHTI